MEKAIQTIGLTKYYPGKPTPSLKDLNLTVERGEIFGYLGPNGAGKTTTIRLMLDFIRPSAGSIKILGFDPRQDSTIVRRQVGNLPGELRLWDHMTGKQIIEYLAKLRPGCDLHYAFEMAERLTLDVNVRAGSYSTGNKRKVGIIQAMMHRPALLIMDEPTTGLDPLVRNTFHEFLREARNNGQTVFLSSHILSEVQSVCDRVAILRQGTLKLVQSVADLQLSYQRIVTIYSQAAMNRAAWEQIDGVRDFEEGPGFIRMIVTGSLDPVIKYAAHHTIEDMRVETVNLEQIFLEYYD